MPTQTVQADEENLIILDDVISNDIQSISSDIKLEDPIVSEDIIDFGGEASDSSNNLNLDFLGEDSKSDDSKIEESSLGDSLLLDSSLQLDDLNPTTIIDQPITTNKSIVEESIISEPIIEEKEEIDIFGSSTQDDSQIKDDSLDLNSILDETIKKLISRQNIISADKVVEQDNIKDFKSQIFELEDNVTTSETIVATLNKEAAKIRSNIKSLERMKLSTKDEIDEIKKETSTKAHNSKRSR